MSILIKGMEMPKSCDECPCFSQYDACDVTGSWKWADEFDKSKERLPDCPLVPVQTHGRLIDADALEVHKFAGAEHDISIADGGACYRRGWNDAVEAIVENAETIIGGE